MTNYDKLLLEVWTDGSVSPEDALSYSAKQTEKTSSLCSLTLMRAFQPLRKEAAAA